LLQSQQDVQQGVRILATGEADHDAVTFLDHIIIFDGLTDIAAQALLQLLDGQGLIGLYRHDSFACRNRQADFA
jgi:hypothetical protein